MDTLDLAVLDSGSPRGAAVLARCNCDIAVAQLPFDAAFQGLGKFCGTIRDVLLFNKPRPKKNLLTAFGHDLFRYVIRDEVQQLYSSLPKNTHVRMQLMTNNPHMQALAWEYLQEPGQAPGPWRDRSIARVIPIIGKIPPPPLDLKDPARKLRILFVFADPQNLDPVSWPSVKASIENAISSRIPPDRFELAVVEGTIANLLKATEKENDRYDIFQYSGHADVDAAGVGRLLLVGPGGVAQPLEADDLSVLLRGRGIRLAVLSACLTAAGNAAEPFHVLAEALVRSGVPAVVANQFPVPDASVSAFAGSLYSNLVTSGDIDKAVNEGRVRLAVELAAQGTVLEWGIPTLYRHISASRLAVV